MLHKFTILAAERAPPSAAICRDILSELKKHRHALLPRDIATATGWSGSYTRKACLHLLSERALVRVGKAYRPRDAFGVTIYPTTQRSPGAPALAAEDRLPRGFVRRAMDGASRPMHLSEIMQRISDVFGRAPTRRSLAVCISRMLADGRILRPRPSYYELPQSSLLAA